MPFLILLFLIAFAPLAIGTVDTWALAIMEALCFCSVLLFFCTAPQKSALFKPPGLLPLALFLGYLLFQLVPLPADLVKFIAPATFQLYQNPLGSIKPLTWLPLSVYPQGTLEEFLRFSAYAAFYLLAVQLLTNRERLKKLTLVIVTLGGIIAFLALLQRYVGNGKIFWLIDAPDGALIMGPYIYKNHFAGYLEMVVPLAVALLLHYLPGWGFGHSFRQRLANFLGHPGIVRFAMVWLGLLIMVIAMGASSSRGGMISLGIASSVFVLQLSAGRRKNSFFGTMVGGALLLSAVLALGVVGWQSLDQLFGRTFNAAGDISDGRFELWRDSRAIIGDFPWFGTGMGTFAAIFQSYRTFAGDFFYYNAHNDYLELLTNTGIIGFALVTWFVIAVTRKAYGAGRKRRDPYARYLTFAALTGVLALLIHSVTDFNFQSGANGLYFFLMLALAVSASHIRSHGKEGSRLAVAASGWRLPLAVVAGVLLLLTVAFQAGQWNAERILEPVDNTALNPDTPQDKLHQFAGALGKGLTFAPLNSHLYFRLAQVQDLLGDVDQAHQLFQQAIYFYPAQTIYHMFYAYFLTRQNNLQSADLFMQAMVRCAPYDPARHRRYGQWLLRNQQREKGLATFSRVLAMAPAEAKQDIATLRELGMEDDEIRAALPERVLPHLAYADSLASTGSNDQASAAYLTALSFINKEAKPQAHYFSPAISFFLKRQQVNMALSVILQGIEVLPGDVGLRIQAGDLYRKMNLPLKARESYSQALQLAPGREDVRKRLRELEGQ